MRATVPALLREATFRRYWSAATISLFGDQISGIAMPLVAVLTLHAGAVQMGYLTALQWLPNLLFGLHAGAWTDRRGHRRQTMIAADLGRAALLVSIPVCFALHVLSIWQLYAVTFAAGTLATFFTISSGTLFVSMLPDDKYMDGQSLLHGSRAMSFVGGPSLGGVLVQVCTAPVAVLADALSFLGSAFFLSRISPPEPPPAEREQTRLSAGLRFIATDPVIRASLGANAVINLFNLMFLALLTLFAVRTLGIRPGVLGLVLGAGALGGVLGAVITKPVAARLGTGMAYVAGCLGFTVPTLLIPLARGSHPLVLATVAFAEFAGGVGVMLLDISIGTIFAESVPEAMRSRVLGAYQAVNYGVRPVGALIGGALGSALGLRPALLIAAAGSIAGGLLLLPGPIPRYKNPSHKNPRHKRPRYQDPQNTSPRLSRPEVGERVRIGDADG